MRKGAWAGVGFAALTSFAFADQPPESWSLHWQATFVDQFHPAFRSPYRGPNSLNPASMGDETFDATLFAGARLWDGGEVYANPELDQGFGLSNTLGMAGFASGEAYKVGKSVPYVRLQRLFFRQTFDLGGDSETIESAANQLGGGRTADNLVITAGKFSVGDIFDTNSYAHDPKQDFLNWSLIDSGAFDYAADAWGYTYGLAAELTKDWWTLRAGVFDLSRVPNSTELEQDFSQFETVAELEIRSDVFGRTGKLKLLGYLNRGRMGRYADAVAQATSGTPDISLVRRYASKAGGAINIEQPVSDTAGLFVRASNSEGDKEAYEFTEINWSVAAGVRLSGAAWNRPNDAFAIAVVANGMSKAARAYFAAGGNGILIGDGRLSDYGTEKIIEVYYAAQATDWLCVSGDFQFVTNPAYNGDRGPVSILAVRLHAAL